MANPKNNRRPPPEICPVCAKDVPRNAMACPECGADDRSGWREEGAASDGLDLPDEDFDYDSFVEEEFGNASKPAGIKPIWWITAIVLFLALALMWLYAAR